MKPASQNTKEEAARRDVERCRAKWSATDRAQWDLNYPAHRGAKSPAYDASRPPGWVRRSNIAHILSRFYAFTAEEIPDLLPLPFCERVTEETMVLFADWLRDDGDCNEDTICDHIVDICRYARACDPTAQVRVIKLEARRLKRRYGRRKRLAYCAHQMWREVEQQLEAIEAEFLISSGKNNEDLRRFAERHRNLLQVGFLLKLPLRLKNLRALDLTHFTGSDLGARMSRDVAAYQPDDAPLLVAFKAPEMKNRQPYRTRLPGELSRHIRFHVEHFRRHLSDLIGPLWTRLWIAPSGAGESAIGIHQCIARLTQIQFQHRLTAHDFRHIVASTAARDGMPRPSIAHLLQQLPNSRTVERYISSWSGKPLRENRAAHDEELLSLVAENTAFAAMFGVADRDFGR